MSLRYDQDDFTVTERSTDSCSPLYQNNIYIEMLSLFVSFLSSCFVTRFFGIFLQLWTCAKLTARISFTASLGRDFITVNAKPDFQVLTVTSILTSAVQILVSMASV